MATALTIEEALAFYDAWLEGNSEAIADSSHYGLERSSRTIYVIFGEQYYFFSAEEDDLYWYKILVHTETGELLLMECTDGMYAETTIVPLEAWLAVIG